ncbi:gliding motility-associated C-terminal domain-containing protein [Flavobacterium wongokense]|uniref:gliding motility-associated C-terminal domain-containing protein n=1 Tax=Flavobacterium wongokense TaxID=2910674 RepID=UPI001F491F46|nr:gliding motility-associated C-terminal domain-containing protein [Flavobacterium sp. WG47]MCF6130761.1 gliding motility-associated C-terminal domain-containing protein [Flavobacterium sp. WG47]
MKKQYLILMLFLLSFSQFYAQNTLPYSSSETNIHSSHASVAGGNACSFSVVPPATINGVNITATSSGVVTYPSAFSSCNGAYVTPTSSIHMGSSGPFNYTLHFTPAVNNLVFVLTAAGHTNNETFIFNTNSNVPTITSSGSCYTTITGNTIYSGAGSPIGSDGGGGIFTVSTTTPFSTLTITGPGGEAGSLMALCASSVGPVGCDAGTVAPQLSTTTITSVCYESTVNLTSITASNMPTGVALAWFTGAVPTAANQLTPAQAAVAPSGTTYYAAFFDSVNNCYSPPTAVTTITQPVTTPTFDPVNPLCFGDPTFELPILSNNGIYGTWFPSINTTQTTSYTFIPFNSACAYEYTMQIEVLNDFDFDVIHYCSDNDFIMEIVPLNKSFDIANATFNWEANSQSVGSNVTFNATSYMNSSPTASLPITFNVSVTNADGCTKTKPITVSSIYCGIQKGISVNGDELNDSFDLTLLNAKQLTIFNRYGMKVYNKDNYVNEWHGQANDGKILPDGTYYYSIEFDDKSPKTGWIYLNKQK